EGNLPVELFGDHVGYSSSRAGTLMFRNLHTGRVTPLDPATPPLSPLTIVDDLFLIGTTGGMERRVAVFSLVTGRQVGGVVPFEPWDNEPQVVVTAQRMLVA